MCVTMATNDKTGSIFITKDKYDAAVQTVGLAADVAAVRLASSAALHRQHGTLLKPRNKTLFAAESLGCAGGELISTHYRRRDCSPPGQHNATLVSH